MSMMMMVVMKGSMHLAEDARRMTNLEQSRRQTEADVSAVLQQRSDERAVDDVAVRQVLDERRQRRTDVREQATREVGVGSGRQQQLDDQLLMLQAGRRHCQL